MAIDASNLLYMEAQIQLQILEHIAQKAPLSNGDVALQRQLESRDHELVQAKLSQAFDAAPRSKDGLDNNDAWKKAAEYPEFRSKAENIARRHLRDEAELSDKRQEDIQKLGQSAELDAAHAGEQRLQARHYDEDRGRYAREFLTARELRQELDEREKHKNVEPGREREL